MSTPAFPVNHAYPVAPQNILPPPEYADVRDVLLAVERLHKSLLQAIEELLDPYRLSMAQWLIISEVAAESGRTLTHFARQLGRDSGSLSRAIYQLSQRGLLNPSRDPLDRRSSRLSLTPEGRRIYGLLLPTFACLLSAMEPGKIAAGYAGISPLLNDISLRLRDRRPVHIPT